MIVSILIGTKSPIVIEVSNANVLLSPAYEMIVLAPFCPSMANVPSPEVITD